MAKTAYNVESSKMTAAEKNALNAQKILCKAAIVKDKGETFVDIDELDAAFKAIADEYAKIKGEGDYANHRPSGCPTHDPADKIVTIDRTNKAKGLARWGA